MAWRHEVWNPELRRDTLSDKLGLALELLVSVSVTVASWISPQGSVLGDFVLNAEVAIMARLKNARGGGCVCRQTSSSGRVRHSRISSVTFEISYADSGSPYGSSTWPRTSRDCAVLNCQKCAI